MGNVGWMHCLLFFSTFQAVSQAWATVCWDTELAILYWKTFLLFDWMCWPSHCFRNVFFPIALQWINKKAFSSCTFSQTQVSRSASVVQYALFTYKSCFWTWVHSRQPQPTWKHWPFFQTNINIAAKYNISRSVPHPEPDSNTLHYFLFLFQEGTK